jgi:hypothetical protein
MEDTLENKPCVEYETCKQMLDIILKMSNREKTKDFEDGFLLGWSSRSNLDSSDLEK